MFCFCLPSFKQGISEQDNVGDDKTEGEYHGGRHPVQQQQFGENKC